MSTTPGLSGAAGRRGAQLHPRPDSSAYLAHLSAQSGRLVDAAQASLGCPVPTCPGWSVDDLVAHTGRVHRRAALMVRERRMEEVLLNQIPAPPPPGPEAVRWLADATRELVEALQQAGPRSPVWNWTSQPQLAGFWSRRMAHETTVHRWDVEAVRGRPSPVERELALDGIAELLEVFLPEGARGLTDGSLGGVLCLRCTDVPAAWCITVEVMQVTTRLAAEAWDARVSGTASDLMMFLWNRVDPETLNVEGNPAIPTRWRAWLRW